MHPDNQTSLDDSQVPPPPPPGTSPPAGERVPWSWLDAVFAFGLALVLTVVALVVASAIAQTGVVRRDLGEAIFLPLSGIVLAATTLIYVKARYSGQVRRLTGWRRGTAKDALIGVGAALGGWFAIIIVIGFLLRLFVGDELPEAQESLRELAANPETLPYLLVGAVLVAPVAEELFFRGMLYQTLRDRLGMWPGIGISSVVFALVHMNSGGPFDANLLVFTVIFPVGMLMAWVFERRGTLVAPIALHAVFNAVQVTVMVATGT